MRRFLKPVFALVLAAPLCMLAQDAATSQAPAQATPPTAEPAAQPATPQSSTPQQAAPGGNVLTGDQVPNMPAYNRKQKPQPQTANTEQPPAGAPAPVNPPVQPVAVPPASTDVYNGPPPAQPLPVPPPTPQPAPVYTQDQIPALPAIKPGPARPAAYIVDELGSPYIPLDSWVYPALLRLYSLGYIDTAYLGQRPWTRRAVMHMLARTSDHLADADEDSEATQIYIAVRKYLTSEVERSTPKTQFTTQLESTYTRFLGILNDPLTPTEGWNVGQSIINDYGRPYAAGYNQNSGVSGFSEWGRFSAYFRGEYQRAPGWYGFSPTTANYFYNLDFSDYGPYTNSPQWYVNPLPSATLPAGPQSTTNNFRVLEADVSAHFVGHEISIGKHDAWLGPGAGGAFAWSNNADNIWGLQINRVEPLYIPFVRKILGPVRYQFSYGDLQGHFYARHPYVHSEKFSFKPTKNLEFGFQRTIIFGGAGHQSVTLHNFLKGFFSASDTNDQEKCIQPYNVAPPFCHDPGARFSAFDFSYRLPKLEKYATLYLDSFVHDDVSPVSAWTRTALRPGIYISQLPFARQVDLRFEGVTTDPPGAREFNERINQGSFLYREVVQREGITNKGVIFGDPVGRQNLGFQGWITWHQTPNQYIQFSYRNDKASSLFFAGGSTQNAYRATLVQRIGQDIEVNAWVQTEYWKAPILQPGSNWDTSIAGQITWYPRDKKVEWGK